jgi:predicted nucleotidyltransferase
MMWKERGSRTYPRDRDLFVDKKDRTFAVYGHLHPQTRVVSLLKYVPDANGLWISNLSGIRYRRVMENNINSAFQSILYAKSIEPSYVRRNEVFGIDFTEIPQHEIKVYLKPEDRLNEILMSKRLDALEQGARDSALAVHDAAGVDLNFIGVTGSILSNTHQPFSDVDLTIYGVENTWKTVRNIGGLCSQCPSIRIIDEKEKWKTANDLAEKTGLSVKEARVYVERKNWLLVYGTKLLSLGFVRQASEVTTIYEDIVFESLYPVRIRATIVDDSESLFHPASYSIEDVEFIECRGSPPHNLERILVYEGAVAGYAFENEEIEVRGLLQRVRIKGREDYLQILIGSRECRGREYIRLT